MTLPISKQMQRPILSTPYTYHPDLTNDVDICVYLLSHHLLLNKYNVANTVDATLSLHCFPDFTSTLKLVNINPRVLYFTTYIWSVNSGIFHVFFI